MVQAMAVESPHVADLLAALRRLDRLLERAIAASNAAYGERAADDPHMGMYISPDDAERLLAQQPGMPWAIELATPDHAYSAHTRLGQLRARYELSSFDMDVLIIALAPELDLRYERLFAFLQDDVTRRRPTVDLALNLLCVDATDKLRRRAHFDADSPLLRHRLVRLTLDPNQVQPPVLAAYLEVDAQIVRWLFGQHGLDPRLSSLCRLDVPPFHASSVTGPEREQYAWLGGHVLDAPRPLRLLFTGDCTESLDAAAMGLATVLERPLLTVDLARASAADPELIGLLVRWAELEDALLYVSAMDEPRRSESHAVHAVLAELVGHRGITMLAQLTGAPIDGGVFAQAIRVRFDRLDYGARRASWQASLLRAGLSIADAELDALAGRFRLGHGQISHAIESAVAQHAWHANGQFAAAPASVGDLFSAARAQSSHALDGLARRIVPRRGFADIVLPDDQLTQLRDIAGCVRYRALVYDLWGFERRLSLAGGINVLFAGPSGTGKTLAAEILAYELGLHLYQIDLSTVVSKYIGETEKNLATIFAAAAATDALLLFDEADTLFGKRTDVHDAHDRYANLEVGYLLQKMDEYDGVVILATNLRKNMDDAFLRRMHYCVEFPFPSAADRQRIWDNVWPPETPLAGDLDTGLMARRFELAGGNIRNIALAASFLAAANGRVVGMHHLLHATRREYQKMGKLVSERDFADVVNEVSGASHG